MNKNWYFIFMFFHVYTHPADSSPVLVKDIAFLFSKEASIGYKDGSTLNKYAQILYKGTDIFNKCGSPGNKEANIFSRRRIFFKFGIIIKLTLRDEQTFPQKNRTIFKNQY